MAYLLGMNLLITKFESLLDKNCLFFRLVALSLVFVVPLLFTLELFEINGLVFSLVLVALALLIDSEKANIHPKIDRAKKIFQAQKQKLRTDRAVKHTEKLFRGILRTNKPSRSRRSTD